MSEFVLGPMQKEWLNALRSGDYKQGCEGLLYDSSDGTYCCLGVAKECFSFKENDNAHLVDSYKELALRDCGGQLSKPFDNFTYLTDMNDSGRYSFNDIADFIEENPELVFTHSV